MRDAQRTIRATEQEPTLLASFAQGVVMFAMSRGLELSEIFDAMGLEPAALSDPDARVPARGPVAVMKLLEERFPDEPLGIQFLHNMPRSALGAVAYVARHAVTVREYMQIWLEYSHIVSSHLRISLEGDVISFGHHFAEAAHCRTIMEGVVARSYWQLRELTGGSIGVAWCDFGTPAPADPAPYHGFFGPRVRFGQPRFAVVLDPGALDLPVVGADPALYRFVQSHLEELARTVSAVDFGLSANLSDVRQALHRIADDGAYTVEALASEVGVSSRTLQRRAREEGTTVKQLLDEHREQRARHLLEERRLTIDDVAFLLGYSDERSFARAFKRWTGSTPAGYRRARD